ncbi:Diacylglycerol kinase zeta [Liparis tanakae]|uniref:Diacylglycerol kinase zeta n=1 Tax=Liparis tanakae TaxID=230148 RepID=A0A4Z2FFZ5_9TELE|nr:Diacylglycerol kinase zeta [Liparis tanakae]
MADYEALHYDKDQLRHACECVCVSPRHMTVEEELQVPGQLGHVTSGDHVKEGLLSDRKPPASSESPGPVLDLGAPAEPETPESVWLMVCSSAAVPVGLIVVPGDSDLETCRDHIQRLQEVRGRRTYCT